MHLSKETYATGKFSTIAKTLKAQLPDNYPLCLLKCNMFLLGDPELHERLTRRFEDEFCSRTENLTQKVSKAVTTAQRRFNSMRASIMDKDPNDIVTALKRYLFTIVMTHS